MQGYDLYSVLTTQAPDMHGLHFTLSGAVSTSAPKEAASVFAEAQQWLLSEEANLLHFTGDLEIILTYISYAVGLNFPS